MMVGGNIKGSDPHADDRDGAGDRQGNFDVAIALAILLLVLMFLVNWPSPRCSSARDDGEPSPADRDVIGDERSGGRAGAWSWAMRRTPSSRRPT
jgi:hypothetical protein